MIDERVISRILKRLDQRMQEVAIGLCEEPSSTFENYLTRVAEYTAAKVVAEEIRSVMKGVEPEDEA